MMILQSSLFTFSFTTACRSSSHKTSTPLLNSGIRQSNPPQNSGISEKNNGELLSRATSRFCSCGRRHFLEAAATALFPIRPSIASDNLQPNYKTVLNRVHPPRPDWYEEFYAYVLNSAMEPYEAEVAVYKSQLFTKLRGKAKKVLEIGIGTGPNLKYYASDADIQVFGVDPNKKMEKYALEAAAAAGLPLSNFEFIQAVGETIPLNDSSVDAVVGTLVLCSVKDVDHTLQDGTILRLLQRALDPLQQAVADGCHLTRDTGNEIFKAGFSAVDLSMTSLSNAFFLNPHVYGIASK